MQSEFHDAKACQPPRQAPLKDKQDDHPPDRGRLQLDLNMTIDISW